MFENVPTKICSHLSTKRLKGKFFCVQLSQIVILAKKKERTTRKSEGGREEEKRKKLWLHN